ncbi:hypothetical protein VYU27_000778 [Nannochloropsis oceanica]
MPAAELKWGAGLIAFSPISSLFLLVVTKRPELVIISIIGAFAYLVALLLSSALWAVLGPGKQFAALTVVMGVICQALMRACLYKLYHKTEILIKSANHPFLHMPLNDVTSSLSAGTGYAVMHCVMLFGSVLASGSSDPGVLYAPSCRGSPLVLVLAFLALAFTLLDLCFMALTFLYMRRRMIRRMVVMLGLHLVASGVTISNKMDNGCTVSLPLVYGVVAAALLTTVREWRELREDT